MTAQRERTTAHGEAAEPSTWARIKLGAGVVALVALVVFLLSNLHQVEIRFLGMEWDTRMIWALVVSAIIGAIAMFVFATTRPRDVR